jgi:hypothetical protein
VLPLCKSSIASARKSVPIFGKQSVRAPLRVGRAAL